MNYLGHKATGILMYPLYTMLIFKYNNNNIELNYINEKIITIKEIFLNYFELINNNIIIFILSIISYWIGNTLIDWIDFKIIKKLIKKEERKNQYLYHRQWTHGLIDNIIILVIILYYLINNQNIYLYIPLLYQIGVINHLIFDMLSGSIPIFFYGHYAKKMTRIGINKIIPEQSHKFFSKKIPKYFDKYAIFLTFTGIFIFFILDGEKIVIQPLLNIFN